MEEVDRYYQGKITLEEAENYIASGLVTAARVYVANGYYLRRIRDDKLYEEAGYRNFEEYVKCKYNKDKGWASKCIKVNQQLSDNGYSPILSGKYQEYSTYQLVEIAYMSEAQREEVSPEMTVQAMKKLRNPKPEIEEKVVTSQLGEGIMKPPQISAYGTSIKVYPEDSRIAIAGCNGPDGDHRDSHDCISCHLQCVIRQQFCYCVEAPMGNPFPCDQIDCIDFLRNEIGERCQFVNLDLAYHRAGDREPVPCCKECEDPCQYACERSVQKREAEPEQEHEDEKVLYFTLENRRSIEGAYGATLAAVVRTYANELHDRSFEPMSEGIPDITVRAMGLEYLVKATGNIELWSDNFLEIKVERQRLQEEYKHWIPEEPPKWNTNPTPCLHHEGYSCTVPDDKKRVPGDGSNCGQSCCWECTKRGDCKWECNSSQSRPEEPTRISELDFSSRTEITLNRAGIDTVDKLASMSDEELAAVRGMSTRTLEEIQAKLEDKPEPEAVVDAEYEEVQPDHNERVYTLEEVAQEIYRLEAAYMGAPEDVQQSNHYRKNMMRLDAMRLLYEDMQGN